MTYEVLLKASKKDLVAWMKRNVCLPDISDEDFLREIKLESLLAKEKELLQADKRLNKQMQQATDDPIKFMQLMIESQKLNEKIEKINKDITALLSDKNNEESGGFGL